MKRFNPFKGSTPEEAARASRLGAYLLVSAVTLSSFGDLRSYSRQTGSIGVDSWALIATCPVYLVGGVFFIYFRRDRSLVLDLFFVVTTAALIIMNFSVVFYEIGTTKNFNHQLTRLDAFYFTATTFTTTGQRLAPRFTTPAFSPATATIGHCSRNIPSTASGTPAKPRV